MGWVQVRDDGIGSGVSQLYGSALRDRSLIMGGTEWGNLGSKTFCAPPPFAPLIFNNIFKI